MKNLIFMFLVIVTVIIFIGCQEDGTLAPVVSQNNQGPEFLAKKPAANLVGEMDLQCEIFANWPEEPVWVGTITFEEYGTYGMRFYHLSEFKGYSQASPFEEYFEIYDLDEVEKVYLGGPDVGVTTTANKPPEDCTYRMNGEIDQAQPPFEGWLGRNVHMSGTMSWQFVTLPDGSEILVPKEAPGIFRIN
jgi:hypothetical protein